MLLTERPEFLMPVAQVHEVRDQVRHGITIVRTGLVLELAHGC
jgi:hypothetical protein